MEFRLTLASIFICLVFVDLSYGRRRRHHWGKVKHIARRTIKKYARHVVKRVVKQVMKKASPLVLEALPLALGDDSRQTTERDYEEDLIEPVSDRLFLSTPDETDEDVVESVDMPDIYDGAWQDFVSEMENEKPEGEGMDRE